MDKIYHQGRKQLLDRVEREPDKEYTVLFYLNVKRDYRLADFSNEQDFFDKLKNDGKSVFSGLQDFFDKKAVRYSLLSEVVIANLRGHDVMEIANDSRIRECYELPENYGRKILRRK